MVRRLVKVLLVLALVAFVGLKFLPLGEFHSTKPSGAGGGMLRIRGDV